jgi:hypothetical protein
MSAFPDTGISHGSQLLPGLQKGDPQAVLAFVRIYRPRIHGFLWRLVHSTELLLKEALAALNEKPREIMALLYFSSLPFRRLRMSPASRWEAFEPQSRDFRNVWKKHFPSAIPVDVKK